MANTKTFEGKVIFNSALKLYFSCWFISEVGLQKKHFAWNCFTLSTIKGSCHVKCYYFASFIFALFTNLQSVSSQKILKPKGKMQIFKKFWWYFCNVFHLDKQSFGQSDNPEKDCHIH